MMPTISDIKEEFLNGFDRTGRELRSGFAELRLQANLAKMDARDAYHQRISQMEKRYAEFKAAIDRARVTMPDDWEETKSRLTRAWAEIEQGYASVQSALTGERDSQSDASS